MGSKGYFKHMSYEMNKIFLKTSLREVRILPVRSATNKKKWSLTKRCFQEIEAVKDELPKKKTAHGILCISYQCGFMFASSSSVPKLFAACLYTRVFFHLQNSHFFELHSVEISERLVRKILNTVKWYRINFF